MNHLTMDDFELCEIIAKEAHAGQKRRGGEPYIEHPRRVARRFDHYALKCIAILHDVVEDSDFTPEMLIDRGVEPSIAGQVQALTHRDGVEYLNYIRSLYRFYTPAAEVKIADIVDNLAGEPTQEQVDRYYEALCILAGTDKWSDV